MIFLYDILIYSPTLEEHIKHLSSVFTVLREKQLLAKLSKSSFGRSSFGFLGHIISSEGVQPDPDKIKAMMDWQIPKTLIQLRVFFELIGYHRRFIRNYAQIASPMTILSKDNFLWTDDSKKSFEDLKWP